MKRKILCLALSLLMVVALLPVSALAAQSENYIKSYTMYNDGTKDILELTVGSSYAAGSTSIDYAIVTTANYMTTAFETGFTGVSAALDIVNASGKNAVGEFNLTPTPNDGKIKIEVNLSEMADGTYKVYVLNSGDNKDAGSWRTANVTIKNHHIAKPVDFKADVTSFMWTVGQASNLGQTIHLTNAGTESPTITNIELVASGTDYTAKFKALTGTAVDGKNSEFVADQTVVLEPAAVADADKFDGKVGLKITYSYTPNGGAAVTGQEQTIDLTAKIVDPFTVTLTDETTGTVTKSYTGSPIAVTVASGSDAGTALDADAIAALKIEYKVSTDADTEYSTTAPTDAGTYTVRITHGTDKTVTKTLTISKVKAVLTMNNATQTEGSVTGLTAELSIASQTAITYQYETDDAPTVNAANCNCANGKAAAKASAHTVSCAKVANNTAECNCGATAGIAESVVHENSCAYGGTSGDSTADCDCAKKTAALAALTNAADHAEGCAAVTVSKSYKTLTTAQIAALTAGTYNVKASFAGDANQNAADTVTAVLTVASASNPVVPTNNFTVTYNAGLHGSLAAGSATSEKVKKGEKPVNVPEVVAEKGYTFVGWSADGRTLVKPAEETITRSVTFTALYADHNAYMVGRSTTTFEPNGQMTRAEAAAVLSRLTAGFEEDGEYTAAPYSDLDTSAWYITYVNFAAEKGIIKGYEDGTFRPNAPITRAELATMIAGYMKVAAIDDPAVSSDVAGHWAEGLIAALEKAQVIKGYEDGTFRPNQNITRAEAATMVNGAIDREPQVVDLAGDGYVNPFTDVAESDWFFKEVMEATVAHLIAHFHAA